MIKLITIPQATASATEQTFLVEITESMCNRVCVNSGYNLTGDVSFKYATPTVFDGIAIIPIIASGTIVINGDSCCGCKSSVRHFSEKFNVALDATTANTIALTQSDESPLVEYANVSKCHTNDVRLTTTLNVTIS